MLIDIHPVADHKKVLAENSGTWSEIGFVERSSSFFPDITSSERILALTVKTRLFQVISKTTYDRIDYVESIDDWEKYITRPRTDGFSGDEADISEALTRLEAAEECLRVHTSFNVATYLRA